MCQESKDELWPSQPETIQSLHTYIYCYYFTFCLLLITDHCSQNVFIVYDKTQIQIQTFWMVAVQTPHSCLNFTWITVAARQHFNGWEKSSVYPGNVLLAKRV